jgi:Mn-dependent DtxR family transcriptional regulator
MNIKAKMIKENLDGSADFELNVDAEGMELLIQWGFVAMIKEAIKNPEYNPQVKKPNEKKTKPSKRKIQK